MIEGRWLGEPKRRGERRESGRVVRDGQQTSGGGEGEHAATLRRFAGVPDIAMTRLGAEARATRARAGASSPTVLDSASHPPTPRAIVVSVAVPYRPRSASELVDA